MMADIPIYALLLFFNAQLFNAYTLNRDTLTNDDLDVLKALLQRLEVTVPEREEVARILMEGADSEHFEDNTFSTKDSYDQPQTKVNRAEAEEFLSARNLKAVRSDSASKRYSGCFGRRMDRIGSMSSLGCNTVGRHNLKRR